ncbi:MAG: hypothetical protein IK114_05605 [Fibrobacter sp.]|nr:hypothetical protein [Fibrobacter sp.]
MIRVWDNSKLREPNEVELGWNKGCVKAKYGKTDTLSNGLVYTCSSTGWSKTGTFSDQNDCTDIYISSCKVYKGVQIGTQVWMAENLNPKSGGFCYNDSTENCTKYGRLYRWSAAMDSAGTFWPNPQSKCGYGKTCTVTYPHRGVCPTGWHIPTISEFETLAATVGDMMKLRSTTGWTSSSANGTDDYSFTALPAGYLDRYIDDEGWGIYYGKGNSAVFLTANEKNENQAYYFELYNHGYYFWAKNKYAGYPIRCVKND